VSAIRVVRQSGRVAVVDDQGAINEHCARFFEGVETRGLSRCTVEAYAHDLALVHRWLFASGQTLAELGAEDVHRFLAWERGREVIPGASTAGCTHFASSIVSSSVRIFRVASSNTGTFARISATEIWALRDGCARLCGGCE
jgi:hypothetical protein